MGDKKRGSVTLVRWEYFNLLRELPATVMLSQIAYWYQPSKKGTMSKLRVFKSGHWWIAKSHKGWWDDCRLTRRQVDRATRLLVNHGLIAVKIFRYGRSTSWRGPPPVRHYRLVVSLSSLHLKCISTIAPTGAFTEDAIKCNGTTIDYSTETTTESTLATVSQAQGKHFKKNNPLIAPTGAVSPLIAATVAIENDNMNSKQVLVKLEEKKQPEQSAPPKNAAGLALYWQKLVPYYHDLPVLEGGLKIKPLTHKEIGMLAGFLKAVGKEEAPAIMRWVVEHWLAYVVEVKQTKGSGNPPTIPRVDYLLKHYDIAVLCYKNSQQPVKSGIKVFTAAEQKAKLHSWGK